MACGVGVCMTCVMPVTGNDGVTRMVRSCVEGPVFRGDRVRWDAFGDGYRPGARRRRLGRAAERGALMARDSRRHDAPRSAAVDAAQPADDGVRLRGQRAGAAPVLRRRELGAFVTKSVMAAPALGARHAADGRDASRDAELDRAAGPGHRRLRRERPRLAAVGRGAASLVSIAGRHAPRSSPTSPQRLRRQPGLRRRSSASRSTSPAPTSPTAGWSSPATRWPRPRSSRSCASSCPADIPVFAKLTPDVTDIVADRAGLRQGRRRRPDHDQHPARAWSSTPTGCGPQLGGRHRWAVRSRRSARSRCGRIWQVTRGDARGAAADGADHRRRGSAHRPRRARAGRGRGQRGPGRHRDLQRPDARRVRVVDELRGPCCSRQGLRPVHRRRRRAPTDEDRRDR